MFVLLSQNFKFSKSGPHIKRIFKLDEFYISFFHGSNAREQMVNKKKNVKLYH